MLSYIWSTRSFWFSFFFNFFTDPRHYSVVGVSIWAWLREREKCRRVFYLTTPSLIKMAAISRMPVSIISRSVQFLLGSRRSLSFKRHEIHSLLVSNHYRRGLQLYSTRRKSSNTNKSTVLYLTAIAVGVAELAIVRSSSFI